MLSKFKTTLRHTSIYGVTNIMKKGAAFLMIPVYTHFLSPSDYGTLELLELVLDVITLLVGLRLSDAVIRYYHHYQSDEEKIQVISTAFLFSVAVTMIAVFTCHVLVSPISKIVFQDTVYSVYLPWIFVCLGCQLLYIVPEAFLMVKKMSLTYSSLSFVAFILALSLNIFFLVKLKLGIWGMIYSMVITKIAYMVLLFVFVLPRLSFSFSVTKLKEMVKFGLPLLPGVLALFVINFSDRFFIQQYCSGHDLGIYSLGYKFGTLLIVLMTDPFFRIWNTQRYEIAAEPNGSVIIGRYFTYYFTGLITLALGLCMFSENIIYIMADDRFQRSADIIPLITLSYIFQGIAGFVTLGIMVCYKTKFVLVANLATAGLNIGLNFYLIKSFGIMGAAISTIVSYAFLFLLLVSLSQRLYRIDFELSRLIKLLFVAIVIFGVTTMVPSRDYSSIVIKAIIFAGFPLGLYLSRFFTRDELEKIKAVVS